MTTATQQRAAEPPTNEVIDEVAQAILQRDDEEPNDQTEPPERPLVGGGRTIAEVARAQGLRVNAPARPDLKPGESVTTVPERWCPSCEEPRGGRKCPRCNTVCVKRVEMEDAEEYEPPSLYREQDPDVSFFGREAEPDDELEYEDDEEQEEEETRSFFQREQPRQQARAAGGARASAPTATPRNQRTPPARGRNQMAQQSKSQRQRVVRRGGEVVHMTGLRARSSQGSFATAEQMLSDQWTQGSIKKELWYQGLVAAVMAHKPETPADVEACAGIADAMYMEMMLRENAG